MPRPAEEAQREHSLAFCSSPSRPARPHPAPYTPAPFLPPCTPPLPATCCNGASVPADTSHQLFRCWQGAQKTPTLPHSPALSAPLPASPCQYIYLSMPPLCHTVILVITPYMIHSLPLLIYFDLSPLTFSSLL